MEPLLPRDYDHEPDLHPVIPQAGFRLAVTLLLAAPLSLLFWLDKLPFYELAATVLAAAVLLFGGWPFFVDAFRPGRRSGRLTLIALALAALLTALLLSLKPGISGGSLPWRAAATVVILLAGGWWEERWLAKTSLLKNRVGRKTEEEFTQADQAQKTGDSNSSSFLVYITIMVALATAAWWGASDPLLALERVSAVLLVASPPAVALAAGWPLRRELSYLLERFGLRLDRAAILERWRRIGVLIVDQDSLFREFWRLIEVRRLSQNYSERTLRHWAASVMIHSTGPVASALACSGRPRRISRYRTIPDQGAEAAVEGRLVRVASLAHGRSLTGGEGLEDLDLEAAEYRVIVVDERVEALFRLEKAPRLGIRSTVRTWLDRGIRTVLLTGESEPDPAGAAKRLGFTEYLVSPVSSGALTAKLGDSATGLASGRPDRSEIALLAGRETPKWLTDIASIQLNFHSQMPASAVDIRIEAEALPDLSALSAAAGRLGRRVRRGLTVVAGYHLVAWLLAAGVWAGWGLVLFPPAAALLGFLPVGGFFLAARLEAPGPGSNTIPN